MKKMKLKTFADTTKKSKVSKAAGKEVVIKADLALFAQMIIIAENRKISDVLCHPFSPLPWALATADGSLRRNNKACLAKERRKNITSAEEIPQPCAWILDGMAMVQKIAVDQKTFAIVLNEGTNTERIDVVFNVYNENTIKNAERVKRGCKSRHEFRNIMPDHKIRQWRKFLLSPTNKMQLIIHLLRLAKRQAYQEDSVCYKGGNILWNHIGENKVQGRPHVNTRGSRHPSIAPCGRRSSIILQGSSGGVRRHWCICPLLGVLEPYTLQLVCEK